MHCSIIAITRGMALKNIKAYLDLSKKCFWYCSSSHKGTKGKASLVAKVIANHIINMYLLNNTLHLEEY